MASWGKAGLTRGEPEIAQVAGNNKSISTGVKPIKKAGKSAAPLGELKGDVLVRGEID